MEARAMNKKLFELVFVGAVLLVVFSNFSSAYYPSFTPQYYTFGNNYGNYYGNYYGGYGNYYDDYSSHTSHTSGYGPYVTTKTTNYNRLNEQYWNGYSWVDRTTYVRETRESPQYYNHGYYDYGDYYDGYNPWYVKYWEQPSYGRHYYCFNCDYDGMYGW